MFVYLITNSETKKIYVGKTVQLDLNKYLKNKIRTAQKGKYKGRSRLFNAMQKYPSTVWSIRPLYEGTSDSDICEHEKEFIKSLGTQDPAIGYNLCEGGQGGWSKEIREKVLATMRSPTFRKAQSRRMKKVMNSPEVKLNVSRAQRNRFNDPTQLTKFREVHNSLKTKNNHSLVMQKRLKDPIKKQELVNASHSESARAKRSASLKSWHSDPLTVEKRKLRAEHISKAKKAKNLAHPLIEKVCPKCSITYYVPFGDRDRVCCSKGCATSYRFRK